jgi:hypothetical protein
MTILGYDGDVDTWYSEKGGRKLDIESVFEYGSAEAFHKVTTLKENQLYWLNYLVNTIEKRRVANILFSNGYASSEVEDSLNLADGEIELIKEHWNEYGTIDMESILESINNIYRRQTLEGILERLLEKKYDKLVIEEVIGLFRIESSTK